MSDHVDTAFCDILDIVDRLNEVEQQRLFGIMISKSSLFSDNDLLAECDDRGIRATIGVSEALEDLSAAEIAMLAHRAGMAVVDDVNALAEAIAEGRTVDALDMLPDAGQHAPATQMWLAGIRAGGAV